MIDKIASNLKWLGHDGFLLDSEKVLYFDPYQITSGPKADIVLISHEHFDHCAPEDVEKVRREDTVVVTEKDSAKKLKGDVRIIKPGESIEVEGVHISGVPAYNTNKDFHPKKKGWLGFLVEISGVTIYHAGDTDFIPEMHSLDVDIALLPVSGTYVMTAEEAVKAARAINPKLAIPMHYGAIVGDQSDAKRFKEALEGIVEVKILPKS